MAGRVAKTTVLFTDEGLDKIEDKVAAVTKKSSTMLSRLPKDLQKQWKSAVEAMGDATKGAVLGGIKDMAAAISAPAKSSFDQVLVDANKFRREVSGVALATGQQFGSVSQWVRQIGVDIGELPASVTAWGRSARQAGGDFNKSIDAMSAWKDRALQLDVPMEMLIEQRDRLQRGFGIEAQKDVNQFFGALDANAKVVGVSFLRLAKQWESAESRFSSLTTSKNLGPLQNLTAAFAASSSSPDIAQGAQAYAHDEMRHGWRLTQKRMQKAGWLKKGETVYDPKTGETSPEMQVKMQAFIAKDKLRFHGSRKRMMEVEGSDDLGMVPLVAAQQNALEILGKHKGDFSKLTQEERKALPAWQNMDAGGREKSEASKNDKDIGAGLAMIKGQDLAVSMGGGAAGLAMNQAAGIFSTAVDKFGGFAVGLAQHLGRGGILGGAGGAGGGAAGGAAGSVAGKVLPALGAAAGGAILGGTLLAGGMVYAGYEANKPIEEEKFKSHPRNPDGSLAELGIAHTWDNPIVLGPAEHTAMGRANAEALRSQVLRVQIVPSISAPPGQPAPTG